MPSHDICRIEFKNKKKFARISVSPTGFRQVPETGIKSLVACVHGAIKRLTACEQKRATHTVIDGQSILNAWMNIWYMYIRWCRHAIDFIHRLIVNEATSIFLWVQQHTVYIVSNEMKYNTKIKDFFLHKVIWNRNKCSRITKCIFIVRVQKMIDNRSSRKIFGVSWFFFIFFAIFCHFLPFFSNCFVGDVQSNKPMSKWFIFIYVNFWESIAFHAPVLIIHTFEYSVIKYDFSVELFQVMFLLKIGHFAHRFFLLIARDQILNNKLKQIYQRICWWIYIWYYYYWLI